ncbi:histidine kinase [Georgenia sp. TF02-10]|uniref:sensor histidine kinase n=1 Tax=Georgenia sp. TF02-10 TaxID=2917725 RepID=UPI001FA6BC89|nr:histidine kinase [Georgenia sp. TF02-10]UNX54560.1 histidine kinase [Georgenia sp. TF02-10]
MTALHEWLARVGIRTPAARDALLAVVVAVVSVGFFVAILLVTAGSPAGPGDLAIGRGQLVAVAVIVFLQALPLGLRRTAPGTCLLLTALMQVVLVAVFADSIRAIAPLLAAYAVGAYARRSRVGWILAGVIALEGVFGVLAGAFVFPRIGSLLGGSLPNVLSQRGTAAWTANYLLSVAITYTAPALLGRFMATRRQYVALLRQRADQAVREREARARSAVAEERARMARELHDIAAHHLSGIVVQAGATERLVDTDPAAAREAARWIRNQGKETLDNMRMVVGILRDRDDGDRPGPSAGDAGSDDQLAPVPGLAALDQLIAGTTGLGTAVRCEVLGDPFPLGPTADLAAYRTLQEALSNARRHSPGAAVAVRLQYLPDRLELRVDSEPPPGGPLLPTGDGGGHGLLGMRERAELIGGTLEAGPTRDGGWRVRLRVPYDARMDRVGPSVGARAAELEEDGR